MNKKQQIIELYKNGIKTKDIAKQLKTSKNTISRIIKQEGIERRTTITQNEINEIINLYPEYTLKQIAKIYKRDSQTIRKILKNNNVEIREPILINTSKHKIKNRYDHQQIIELYKNGHSIIKITKIIGCAHETVRQVLLKNNILIKQTTELFKGKNNPFYGKKHNIKTKEKCKEIGIEAGKRFWEENPEYRDVVKEVQREIWDNKEKREEQSKRSFLIAKNHKFFKGKIETRFGEIKFDSSYEMEFIKLCVSLDEIESLERNFDFIKYTFNNIIYHYIPDFRVKTKEKEIVVEIKSDNLLTDSKTILKYLAGKEKYKDYIMINNDFTPFVDWVYNNITPFDFKDTTLLKVKSSLSKEFYNKYHYLGYDSGHTFIVLLDGKIIASATFGGITRIEIAQRLGTNPSEILELRRFCIHPNYHKKNFATWFMGKIIKKMKGFYESELKSLKCLVSFSDESQGHEGIIYKASNWEFDGMTKKNYIYIGKNQKTFHKRRVWDKAKEARMSENEYAKQNNFVKKEIPPKKRWLWIFS